jgi:hypothetical protein
MPPLLSVVVPIYNAERFLFQTIKSITNQTFKDFELLLIDDGSTDQSHEIIRDFASRDNRIRAFHKQNGGIVSSCNFGTEHALGKYIAHVDHDDIVSDRFSEQIEFLEARPDYVLLGTAYRIINEEYAICDHNKQHYTEDRELRERLPYECPFTHSSIAMRRDACLAVGGYRRAFETAEDYDLWLRLSRVGKIANLPQVGVLWRRHSRQASLKYLEQQMRADLAVKFLVRCFNLGKPDPFANMTLPLRRDDLVAAGIAPCEIDRHTLDGFELWAREFWQNGETDAALSVYERLWMYAQKSGLNKDEIARYGILLATRKLQRKQWGGAIKAAGGTLSVAPFYPLRWMKNRINKRSILP